ANEKDKKISSPYEELDSVAALQALKKAANRDRIQALQGSFIRALKEKNIPLHFARGHVIENDEQLTVAIEAAEKEYFECVPLLSNCTKVK
ncbi:MAG: hypothetical protein ABIU77_27715, partial [Ferruginibacter sp.]